MSRLRSLWKRQNSGGILESECTPSVNEFSLSDRNCAEIISKVGKVWLGGGN